jgi:hypothetical protein
MEEEKNVNKSNIAIDWHVIYSSRQERISSFVRAAGFNTCGEMHALKHTTKSIEFLGLYACRNKSITAMIYRFIALAETIRPRTSTTLM